MNVEEERIIDAYEDCFVINKEFFLKQLKLSKSHPEKKATSTYILILVWIFLNVATILIVLSHYFTLESFKNFFLAFVLTNIIVIPLLNLFLGPLFEQMIKFIWMRSKKFQNQLKIYDDSVIFTANANNTKDNFAELVNKLFSAENLQQINPDSFPKIIKSLYRVNDLYFEYIELENKINYTKKSSLVNSITPISFLSFLNISRQLTYDTFEVLRDYIDFYNSFLNRIKFRKAQIGRRRVTHTISAEIDYAYNEFFIEKKVDEKLVSFYKCFTEEEIQVLNLDFIKNELEALQLMKQRYMSAYTPKEIVRYPYVRSKEINKNYSDTSSIRTEKALVLVPSNENKNIDNIKELERKGYRENDNSSNKESSSKIKINSTENNFSETNKASTNKNKVKRKTKISKELLEQKLKQNNLVGELGEQFIFEKELEKMGSKIKPGFKIIHSSKELGDGLGYDIESFEDDYKKKYIEVKTTTATEIAPFFLSKNELNKLQSLSNLQIYRVINFSLLDRNGDIVKIISKKQLEDEYDIVPSSYLVRLK